MTLQRSKQAAELFEKARRLDAAQRRALLDHACAGDDELRRAVEQLLSQADSDEEFRNTADVNDSPHQHAGAHHKAPLPHSIGPYRIINVLGEGGFGFVYLAEQSAPVHRRVALKVIKPGMDSHSVLARFEAERQALALMDHPNVAKVFDGGTTEQGLPYFVMEYVKGEPITDFCDRHRFSIRDRIELMIRVCHAVQHAHQKGIIHRDIKPTNILVFYQDSAAVPMVIDFGVAKALDRELTEKTIFTEIGQLIGTPAYMSPEQAEMSSLDIDTRSDIYSLGVLLYELLTGLLPFDPKDLHEKGYAEIQRIIREVEPPKPSTKLSTVISHPGDPKSAQTATRLISSRRTDAGTLTRLLRGDLDWVVMKCLEKDRARRYESASGLAADLRRYLDDEPVSAGPPSAAYRASKFIRRHRAAVWSGSAIAALLIIGTLTTTILAIKESRARQDAVAAATRAREAETAIRAQRSKAIASARDIILGLVDQLAKQRASTASRAVIVSGLADYLEQVAADAGDAKDPELSLVLAEAYTALGEAQGGTTSSNIGEHASAIESLTEAIEQLEALNIGAADRAVQQAHWKALYLRGDAQHAIKQHDASNADYLAALDIANTMLAAAPDEPSSKVRIAYTVMKLADVAKAQGRIDDARKYLAQTIDVRKELYDADPTNERAERDYMRAIIRSADMMADLGDKETAAANYELAYQARLNIYNSKPQDRIARRELMNVQLPYGDLLQSMGEVERGAAMLEGAEDHAESLFFLDPNDQRAKQDFTRTITISAQIRLRQGDAAGAEAGYKRAINAIEQTKLIHQHAAVGEQFALVHNWLGRLYLDQARLDDAEECFTKSKSMYESLRDLAPLDADLLLAWAEPAAGLAEVQYRRGDNSGALEQARRVLAELPNVVPADRTPELSKQVHAIESAMSRYEGRGG